MIQGCAGLQAGSLCPVSETSLSRVGLDSSVSSGLKSQHVKEQDRRCVPKPRRRRLWLHLYSSNVYRVSIPCPLLLFLGADGHWTHGPRRPAGGRAARTGQQGSRGRTLGLSSPPDSGPLLPSQVVRTQDARPRPRTPCCHRGHLSSAPPPHPFQTMSCPPSFRIPALPRPVFRLLGVPSADLPFSSRGHTVHALTRPTHTVLEDSTLPSPKSVWALTFPSSVATLTSPLSCGCPPTPISRESPLSFLRPLVPSPAAHQWGATGGAWRHATTRPTTVLHLSWSPPQLSGAPTVPALGLSPSSPPASSWLRPAWSGHKQALPVSAPHLRSSTGGDYVDAVLSPPPRLLL